MTAPDLAPPRTLGGIIIVWIVAAVTSVLIGVLAPEPWRAAWMPIGLGVCLIVAFAVQLWHGRSHGFIQRVAISVLGAMLVMGFIGIGFGLSTLFSV